MKTKKLIRGAAFVVITALLLVGVSNIMISTNKDSAVMMAGFYQEEKDSLDVVAIGASEVYTGYSPILAWEEYGYTSYALASMGLGANMYKPLVKEVLRTQNPQVIALDINGFLNGDKYLDREGSVRNIIDNMPMSRNKIETIRENIAKDQRMEYYLPLLTYHNNWATPREFLNAAYLKLRIWMNGYSNMKGSHNCSHRTVFTEYDYRENHEMGERVRASLIDLLEYCKAEGVENMVFFRTPHVTVFEDPELLDEIGALVEEYGYDWLNCDLIPEESGIALMTDFYNREHLNLDGMEKWTSYLGKYICEHYAINTEHSPSVEAQWEQAAVRVDAEMAQGKSDLKNGVIRLLSESDFYMPTVYVDCAENLGDGACANAAEYEDLLKELLQDDNLEFPEAN